MSFAYESLPRGWSSYEGAHGIKIFQSNLLSRARCVHGFTARFGGVSLAPYDSLNLAFTRPEPRENVMENYARLATATGIPLQNMALASYAHGVDVHVADQRDGGAGIIAPPLPQADGLVTREAVTLVTLHADCLCVLFYDTESGVCGACHAGWRGVARGVALNTLHVMRSLGARVETTLAWVGPGVCPACYEVDEPVIDEFERAFPEAGALYYMEENDEKRAQKPGEAAETPITINGNKSGGRKARLDLSRAMAFQLLQAGILQNNIELSGLCTSCSNDFFSFRRDAGKTGAMAAFIRHF